MIGGEIRKRAVNVVKTCASLSTKKIGLDSCIGHRRRSPRTGELHRNIGREFKLYGSIVLDARPRWVPAFAAPEQITRNALHDRKIQGPKRQIQNRRSQLEDAAALRTQSSG